jgi:molybdate transport system ATP-binding protein
MDEPLAALDAARKAEILPYLERLHRELALPVVYVTHAMDEVARLADHLVLMREGRVEAAGPLTELLSRTDLPLSRQDDAGVVIDAQVIEHDRQHGMTRIGFNGASLWVGESPAPPGERVRARVLARDVSVTR